MNTLTISRVVIVLLTAVLLVLGYLYYQEKQSNVKVKLELTGIKIEKSN